MTSIATELTERSHKAADYLNVVGWTQGEMKDSDGRVCLTGAVKYCDPQEGDFCIIREVLHHRERAESWNDSPERTKEEVENELRKDISDDELAEVFGPQWLQIVALIRRATLLSSPEINSLVASLDAAWSASLTASWRASLAAARSASLTASRLASLDAAWHASLNAASDASRHTSRLASAAASAAASALSVRDLIGQHGFTQEHYDTLTGPWRKIIGSIHEDDVDLKQGD